MRQRRARVGGRYLRFAPRTGPSAGRGSATLRVLNREGRAHTSAGIASGMFAENDPPEHQPQYTPNARAHVPVCKGIRGRGAQPWRRPFLGALPRNSLVNNPTNRQECLYQTYFRCPREATLASLHATDSGKRSATVVKVPSDRRPSPGPLKERRLRVSTRPKAYASLKVTPSIVPSPRPILECGIHEYWMSGSRRMEA